MKQIRIIHYQTPKFSSVYIKQKHYSVWLGNHSTNYFTSEKDALRFLAETNRFLNDYLHELNYLYGVIFMEYRQIWFYTKDKEDIEEDIINCFKQVDQSLIRLTTRGQTTNGNAFVFNWIMNVCDSLENVLKQLIDLYNERKDFADLRRVKIFSQQVGGIKRNIEQWGTTKPT